MTEYLRERARNDLLPQRRVGLIYPYPDPASARHWSGIPNGLAHGFVANGAEVLPLGGSVPLALDLGLRLLTRLNDRAGTVAQRAAASTRLRTRRVTYGLSSIGKLDAVVAMDTEAFDLSAVRPPGVPVATYDDGTFAAFARHADSDVGLRNLPGRAVAQWSARQRAACHEATVCCVATQWAADSVIADYGVPPERVAVVGMGHRPRAVPDDGRDWSAARFLFVGADWRRKNGDALLRAFARVRETRPHATLDVIGEHPPLDRPGVTGHGFLRRDVEADQRKLDILYARATAFVLPSRFDAAGIVYLEAASTGLPVIATTEGGAGELLGEGAVRVHPDDEAGLVHAMLQLTDGDFAKRSGAVAARRAATATWTAVTRRILDCLGL